MTLRMLGLAGISAAVLAASAAPALAQSIWQTTFSTDMRFFTWSSSRQVPGAATAVREKGWQMFVPLSAQVVARPSDDWKLEFLARGGLASSSVKVGGVSGSYTGLTDTTVSGTVTYYGIAGIQPFFSLALNLPTGETVLRGANANTKSDPDNAFLPVFGEGFNIGPTIGVAIPITESLTGTLSVGYTSRGAFDREGPLVFGVPTTLKFNPGDVLTANAGLSYRGEQLSLKASLSYSIESTTKRDGLPFYRAGDRLMLVLGGGYAFNEAWSARVQGSLSQFGKNEVQTAGLSALQQEAFNSNSTLTKVTADVTYAGAGYSISPTVTFMYRDRNGYDPTAFEFVTAKRTWTAGVAANYAPRDNIRLSARVERLWAHENGGPDKLFFGFPIPLSGNPKVTTNGWQFALSGSIKF